MNEYNQLLRKAANLYGVKKGVKETEKEWMARIVYTITGRMGMASLWDQIEEGSTSIVHVKERMKTIFEAYQEMYSQVRELRGNAQTVADEIYDLYLRNGLLYHQPNRVVMAAMAEGKAGSITLTRGYPLDPAPYLSGVGTYLLGERSDRRAEDLFPVGWEPLQEVWGRLIEDVTWSPMYTEMSVEYLRMKPPFSSRYWENHPDETGRVSLLRIGFKGARSYYLYRMKGEDSEGNQARSRSETKEGNYAEALEVSQLPNWMVDQYEYRALACGCLAYHGVLPAIRYKEDGEIVSLRFGYLPPPSDLSIWKLYSWPASIDGLPSDFSRICVRRVFEALKEMFSKKGYIFEKEL